MPVRLYRINHEAHEGHEVFWVVLDISYGGLLTLRFGCAGCKVFV